MVEHEHDEPGHLHQHEHEHGHRHARTGLARSRRRILVGLLTMGALLIGVVAFAVVRSGTAAATATVASGSGSASCATSAPHLTVQGSGQGSGTPDVLTAVFGFSTTASSSSAALSQNNTKVATALQALSANGVASRDTQTTGLNLSAQYAYPHGVPTLTGYQATETVSATLRHPSTEGAAIDAVVNATGNAAQIDSLTFSFGNPGAVQDKARTAAVHQAVAHAQAMATAADRKLGPVCSLTDNTQPAGPGPDQSFNGLALPSAGTAALPLAPGTQVESDQVTMVYALER
jgi:uncharacterized protein YggE